MVISLSQIYKSPISSYQFDTFDNFYDAQSPNDFLNSVQETTLYNYFQNKTRGNDKFFNENVTFYTGCLYTNKFILIKLSLVKCVDLIRSLSVLKTFIYMYDNSPKI